MPKVGGKKYSYDKKGMAAAKRAAIKQTMSGKSSSNSMDKNPIEKAKNSY
jgi:hypothetical protein